jgi:peptide/nickel transport system permease protein
VTTYANEQLVEQHVEEVALSGGGSRLARASSVVRTFSHNRLGVLGIVIVILMFGFCFLGPFLYHTDQVHTNLSQVHLPPSANHPLGTDPVGYDVLGRLMVGGQASLEVALAAAVIATAFGAIWGAVSGFIGGIADAILMRAVDAMLSVPPLLVVLFLATIYRPSVPMLVIVVAIVAWLIPSRLVRGETLILRTLDYVMAVRAFGGTRRRAIFRHVLPNSIGTIVTNVTFQVADAVLLVAGIGYLGLGIPPPGTDWGSMLSSGINYIYSGYWWLIYPAGVCIVLTVVAFNFIGDALRDAFEIRLRER